ncbi:MAG: phosphoribosylanthranilate isomerase [Flavobacteriia bacterium]
MKVKVCGINDLDAMANLEKIGSIDFLGFIFYEESKRFVKITLPKVKVKNRVGVFVNETESFIKEKIKQYDLDFVQLHGNESPEFCRRIKKNIPVIKAFGVDSNFAFSILNQFVDAVDYFLFDTKTEIHGGSGLKFNWNLLANYTLTTPFFLSGGISPNDVSDIKKLSHPAFYGLDLNSGFELEPGIKDVEKVNTFIKKYYENSISSR